MDLLSTKTDYEMCQCSLSYSFSFSRCVHTSQFSTDFAFDKYTKYIFWTLILSCCNSVLSFYFWRPHLRNSKFYVFSKHFFYLFSFKKKSDIWKFVFFRLFVIPQIERIMCRINATKQTKQSRNSNKRQCHLLRIK